MPVLLAFWALGSDLGLLHLGDWIGQDVQGATFEQHALRYVAEKLEKDMRNMNLKL